MNQSAPAVSSKPALQAAGLATVQPANADAILDLQARAGDAAALLKALAHPDRLMLLCQLLGGERSVNALGALAGVAQPSLSQQLGVLRGERLVATRREGKQVVYRLASAPASVVLQTLYGLFCGPSPLAVVTPERLQDKRGTRRNKETA